MFKTALTFDDVLIKPAYSTIIPAEANTTTTLAPGFDLTIPLLSAAMDSVTEAPMAIALAQLGGLGVIHRNMSLTDQVSHIRRVKKFEAGMVIDPISITPEAPVAEALDLMKKRHISGVPVLENRDPRRGKLVGILTNRDVRFVTDPTIKVAELMTAAPLITVDENVTTDEARRLLHQHRIEKLLVVDDDYHCIGLITVKDIEKARNHPHACKDLRGRLRVGAAIMSGENGFARAEALIEAEVDLIVIDSAHGHSANIINLTRRLKEARPETVLMAGNIATGDAAEALIEAGASVVKVGVGPGSICTTRVVAGVGVPQLSAIFDVAAVARKRGAAVIADGGIRYSGDIAKALAAGADAVMLGSLLAGADESPGDIVFYQGRRYKSYRGMGSLGAMARGSADRYFQQEMQPNSKLVPEGVEGRVDYKGALADVVHQLIGGVKAAMGYTGGSDIAEFRQRCEFVCVSAAALRESHVHDIIVTQEAPNYPLGG